MNLRERYYLLDFYSKMATVFWIPFILVLMFLGLSIGWQLPIGGFIFGFFLALVFGLVIGLPMVLFGQAIGVFLDQAEMLVALKQEVEEEQ